MHNMEHLKVNFGLVSKTDNLNTLADIIPRSIKLRKRGKSVS